MPTARSPPDRPVDDQPSLCRARRKVTPPSNPRPTRPTDPIGPPRRLRTRARLRLSWAPFAHVLLGDGRIARNGIAHEVARCSFPAPGEPTAPCRARPRAPLLPCPPSCARGDPGWTAPLKRAGGSGGRSPRPTGSTRWRLSTRRQLLVGSRPHAPRSDRRRDHRTRDRRLQRRRGRRLPGRAGDISRTVRASRARPIRATACPAGGRAGRRVHGRRRAGVRGRAERLPAGRRATRQRRACGDSDRGSRPVRRREPRPAAWRRARPRSRRWL